MAAKKVTQKAAKQPAPKKEMARLSEAQISEVLELMRESKTVELKLTVPEASYRSTARALGLDPLDAQLRQVVFFDTPDLALNKAGVVVRARRSQGAPDDTVVKLRPVIPKDLPAELRALPDFGVEVDALPGGFVCSASFKAELSKNHVRAAMLGERRISKLFSPGQRAVRRVPRSSRPWSRRPVDPRSVERVEAQVRSEGLRPAARCRAVAVPRRVEDPRAVDQVRPVGGVPGRGREPWLPHRSRHRSVR